MAERIYTRGSNKQINTDNQLSELRPLLPNAILYEDVMTGSVKRPELERMISDCIPGDVVWIWSLDRLSRQGIHATLDYLKRIKDKGARVRSLKESWLDSEGQCYEMMVSALSFAAKLERDRCIERTCTGIKQHREAKGKPVLDRKAIAEAPGGMSAVAAQFGCSRQYVHQCRREFPKSI